MASRPQSQKASAGEDCWAKVFSLFRKYNLERRKGMQESRTGKDEMKQQQRMKIIAEMIRNIKAEGRMDANSSWRVSDRFASVCGEAWLN